MNQSTSHDELWMREALIEAEKALAQNTFPVGAVLVKDHQIVARSHKTMSSHLLDHAETNLLREAMQGLVKNREAFTLYTTLEPCLMCFGTIRHCAIGRLVYAMEDPYGGATHLPDDCLPPRHHIKPFTMQGGVLRAEAKALFNIFLSSTDEAFWVNGGAKEFQELVKA